MIHLYKVKSGIVVSHENDLFLLKEEWDDLINRDPLYEHLIQLLRGCEKNNEARNYIQHELLAPIGSQEVWAAGVTWWRSREARMDEAKSTGAAVFYDKVYTADRPELFFKAAASRVAGHGEVVNIRRDSSWNVPEPELTLMISNQGKIQGYTIGNDMSSRSIEGENPLYLPQAKTWQRSAALGPCVAVMQTPIGADTIIAMDIVRGGTTLYDESVALRKMKRTPEELVSWLYRECDFVSGCFLMTGTCLVPPDAVTLQPGDCVTIRISGIGTLMNTVGIRS